MLQKRVSATIVPKAVALFDAALRRLAITTYVAACA